MSFDRQPKPQSFLPPNPGDDQNQPKSGRQVRLATGGTRSTFLGSMGQSALPGPGPTLTGVSGGR